MARTELDKIHSLNAVIVSLEGDIEQSRAELGMLEHLNDDAQRDAVVSDHAQDRQDARMTASDVQRMGRHISKLEAKRAKTVARRDGAVDKLHSG